MKDEYWRYDQSDNLQVSQNNGITTLTSNEQEVLSEIFTAFGHRPFLRHHTQAFHQAPIINAYEIEERNFLMNIKTVPRSSVPKNANIIGSHTIYKLKVNDD